MRFEIRAHPRSSKEEITRTGEKTLNVYMYEPASAGKANKKLIEMLAEYFGTKKNCVAIISGLKRKTKIVEIFL